MVKLKSFLFAAVLIALISNFCSNAITVDSNICREAEYMPGSILVGFSDDIDFTDLNKGGTDPILNNLIIRSIPELKVLEIKVKSGRENDFIENYERSDQVKYAEKNYLLYTEDIEPEDPLWDKQWGTKNIKCPQAWEKGTGSNQVVVAIIDTGVDYTHLDLEPNMWTDSSGYYGYDFADDDTDPMDQNGHGTHCAGIVAAKMDDYGMVGVAQVKIMAVRVLDAQGDQTDIGIIASGITYAINNSADVISLSLGHYFTPSLTLQLACDYAWNHGCVVVAAAGNDNNNWEHYPSGYDNVISVGATDNKDEKAKFSNWGDKVDVAAPGYGIISCHLNGGYKYLSGTSMACPYVAGVAALAKSQNPGWTNIDIRHELFGSADPLGYEGYYWNYGKIDATLEGTVDPVLPHVTVEIFSITNEGDGLDKIDVDGNPEWFYDVTVDGGDKKTIVNFNFDDPTEVSGEYFKYFIENFHPDGYETNTWNDGSRYLYESEEAVADVYIMLMEDDFVLDFFSDIADISSRNNPGGDYEFGYDERGRVFTVKYDLVTSKIIDEQSDIYLTDEDGHFYTRGDWDGSTHGEFWDWKQDDAQVTFNIYDNYLALDVDAGGPYEGFCGRTIELVGYAMNGIEPYTYNWDIDNDSDYELEGKTVEYSWGESGVHTVNLKVTDWYGQSSIDTTTVTIAQNNAPEKPTISGPTNGVAGNSYDYTVYASDPEDDNVQFYFEWGDGKNSGWTEEVESDESFTKSHKWSSENTFTIKVKCRDVVGEESGWTHLEVTMPKEKPFIFIRLSSILERYHPLFYRILSNLF